MKEGLKEGLSELLPLKREYISGKVKRNEEREAERPPAFYFLVDLGLMP